MSRYRLLLAALALTIGCDRYDRSEASSDLTSALIDEQNESTQIVDGHLHPAGLKGGTIVSLGDDVFHAEAVFDGKDRLSIFILGSDVTRLHPIPNQSVTSYVREQSAGPATALLLKADPVDGDPEGMATRFSLVLPPDLQGSDLYVAVPGLMIDGVRYMVRLEMHRPGDPSMPIPVSVKTARKLYLTAGGRYTEQDIEDNGRQTARQKYTAFQPEHDPNPSPGELICPITDTKANPDCTWIIGGQTYSFCCPPCIDEFLERAKKNPKSILHANGYRR